MTKLSIITFGILFLIGILSTNAQNKVYNPSENPLPIKEEKIILNFYEVDLETDNESGAVIATIAPAVVKAGLSVTKYILKRREEKFSADYGASNSNDLFYEADKKLNLKGLNLIRSYKKENDNDFEDGINMKLLPDISEDRMAFRYGIDYLELKKAKAKVTKKNDYLNLSIEIEINAYIEKEGKLEEATLGKRSIAINGVKFNRVYEKGGDISEIEYWSNWFPIPNFKLRVFEDPAEKIDNNEVNKTMLHYGMDMENLITKGWIKSENGDHYLKFLKIADDYYKIKGSKQAGGNYSVQITIKEVNPRILTTQKTKEFFNENSESINDLINVSITNAFGSGKSENEE